MLGSGQIPRIARDAGVRFTPGSALAAFPVPPKTHERLISLVIDQDTTGFLRRINIVSGLKETEGKLLCSGWPAA